MGNSCCNGSGVSSQIMHQLEEKRQEIQKIFPGLTSFFILDSEEKPIFTHDVADERQAEIVSVVGTLKQEVQRTGESLSQGPFSVFHVSGAKELFSCYMIKEFTLGFFSHHQRNTKKEFLDTSPLDEKMRVIILELANILETLTIK
ncbi:hypothetical protein M0811_04160 [Anaeramoeba ignava]|uniref:Uncharacterized protein n=1 Tax=Anaeramoeba ignava TaxID=1746090 RepID=A0A9Q0LVN7_ANAIG|nr:hypothetical protein M0811_04160 [Anaeramoeba ignava]